MADSDLHIVEQLQLAQSRAEVAQILLRVSDAVLMTHGEVMTAECRRLRFPEAVTFIDLRLSVLDAVRDRSGRLPDRIAGPVENWRIAFAAYAQATPR